MRPVPSLRMEALHDVPALVATRRRLRLRRRLRVEAFGAWWELRQGSVEATCLSEPQRRGAVLVEGALVFLWQGEAGAADVRRKLPPELPARPSIHRVEMACPYYLALYNGVDYAHFARHRFYGAAYAVYRRVRRNAHVPGDPFRWQVDARSDERVELSIPEAGRRLHLYATAAEFVDSGVNRFQTFVTPLSPTRSAYWECYSPTSDSAALSALARLAFWALVVPLLVTEDRQWTGASAAAFLRGDNIHLSANDVPLGQHLRHHVLPLMETP